MTLEIGQLVQHKLTGRVGTVIGRYFSSRNEYIYIVDVPGKPQIKSTWCDFQLYTRMPSR